jgi:hypothetical protein
MVRPRRSGNRHHNDFAGLNAGMRRSNEEQSREKGPPEDEAEQLVAVPAGRAARTAALKPARALPPCAACAFAGQRGAVEREN